MDWNTLDLCVSACVCVCVCPGISLSATHTHLFFFFFFLNSLVFFPACSVITEAKSISSVDPR